jgi:hypothetical protein
VKFSIAVTLVKVITCRARCGGSLKNKRREREGEREEKVR